MGSLIQCHYQYTCCKCRVTSNPTLNTFHTFQSWFVFCHAVVTSSHIFFFSRYCTKLVLVQTFCYSLDKNAWLYKILTFHIYFLWTVSPLGMAGLGIGSVVVARKFFICYLSTHWLSPHSHFWTVNTHDKNFTFLVWKCCLIVLLHF